MKILLSLILLMSLPAFSENTEPVDHTKQAELINQIRQGKKNLTGADLRGATWIGANLAGTYINSKYRDMIMASGALNTDKIKWVD